MNYVLRQRIFNIVFPGAVLDKVRTERRFPCWNLGRFEKAVPKQSEEQISIGHYLGYREAERRSRGSGSREGNITLEDEEARDILSKNLQKLRQLTEEQFCSLRTQ